MLPTAAPDGPPQRPGHPGRPGRPAHHRCRQRRRPTRLPVPAAIASSAGKPHGKPCGSGGSRNIGSGLKLCEKLYEIMSDWIMFNCDLFVCCHLLILSVNLVWPQWVQNGPKPWSIYQTPDHVSKTLISFRKSDLCTSFTWIAESYQCKSHACQGLLWVHAFVPFEVYTCSFRCTNFACPAPLKSHNDAQTQRNYIVGHRKKEGGPESAWCDFLDKWIGPNKSQYIQDDLWIFWSSNFSSKV